MKGDQEQVKSCVFASELIQIYELIREVIRSEPDVQIYIEAANYLPVKGTQYFMINLNEQEIISEALPEEPEKSEANQED